MTGAPGRIGRGIVGLLLVLGVLVAAPERGGAAAPAPTRAGSDLVGPATIATTSEAEDVLDYWTRGRMETARPLGLGVTGDLLDPVATGTGAPARAAARAGLPAPRSTGKLFFTMPEGDAVCSASAVSTPQRNVIITAAHCAHSGDGSCGLLGCTTGEYFTNFLFVPRYANGTGPDGQWVGGRAVVPPRWISDEDLGHDQALIELLPRGGRNLVDVVGGNGLAWNYPPRQAEVGVWGWPAEAPYDGESAHACGGSTGAFEGTADAGIVCPMTGGSSGGPWFLGMVNQDVGFIWAVTSRRTVRGTPTLVAPPLTREIRDLLAVVHASRPVAPRSSMGGSAVVRAAKVRLRVPQRHVGRGQTIRMSVRAPAGRRVVVKVRKSKRGKWRRLLVGRTSSARTVSFGFRARKSGLRWYRVRAVRRTTKPVRLRIHPCPLPVDRRPGVVQATGCSSPSG